MFPFFEFGFGGFGAFGLIFILFFLVFIGAFIFVIVKSISQYAKNNNSPRLIVPAKIVSKTTHVSHHHNASDSIHSSSYSTYTITFEVESGDRIQLNLNSYEYGMLAEGDMGTLTFQGTRYISFVRK